MVQNELDWEYVLSEAAENSIVPLVSKSILQVAADLVPGAVRDKLKEANRANTVRNLYLSAELTRILRLFESESIQAIPYKGPVLACMAYGDVTLREFEDLDIILSQKDLPRAHILLERQGYQARFPWILSEGAKSTLVPGEYNYRDKSRHVMVELHTELTLRHFPQVPDVEALARPLMAVNVAGNDILTFSPEVTLVLLCLHGSKDFWERLSWVADISEFLSAYPSLNWQEIYRRAESLRSVRILQLGLQLAVDFFGAELPPFVQVQLEEDLLAKDLAQGVWRRLMSRDFPHLNSMGRFRFRRRLLTGRWRGMQYSIRLTLVPTEDDWDMIQLPGALSPLYIFLRPLRLLRKYGVRGPSRAAVSPSTAPPKS